MRPMAACQLPLPSPPPIPSAHPCLETAHPTSASITSGVRGLLADPMENGKQLDGPVHTRAGVTVSVCTWIQSHGEG